MAMDLDTIQVDPYAYRTRAERIARTAGTARVEQTSDRARMLSVWLWCDHDLTAYPVTILWQASCHHPLASVMPPRCRANTKT